ncbi:Uncharacterised protein [Salmonella enterica subsp. enterica serovar Bovismorbificans]|uniref:Uncharacterized protein n=1 Tax=Salmonella enterica subsp. enterica serovar Bovismorbificans TaxID=58097 RepID=A0A379NEY7_SALET|nr:Uncharacterised protein [Salmonella enterica subsp. enterica serovar Bovismorbificans]SUE45236.1 Uncharacterised protein [Salmonella enterica subsp. enterica serovar Bovismorbificans]
MSLCGFHVVGAGDGVEPLRLLTGPGELPQPVLNTLPDQLAGHQVDTQGYPARQFGTQQMVKGERNGLVSAVDRRGFQHKAHRGVIHEQAGLLVIVPVRQQTAELREAHLAEDLIGLCRFIRHLQRGQQRVGRLSDSIKQVLHTNTLTLRKTEC